MTLDRDADGRRRAGVAAAPASSAPGHFWKTRVRRMRGRLGRSRSVTAPLRKRVAVLAPFGFSERRNELKLQTVRSRQKVGDAIQADPTQVRDEILHRRLVRAVRPLVRSRVEATTRARGKTSAWAGGKAASWSR
jgi:hypothetical protein